MRAAVCYELGQPLVVEDVELDPPHAGEVQVRTAAVAICHSDVHLVRGDWVTNEGRRLFVAFTVRRNRVRIISARPMSRKERVIYEEAR